MFNYIYEVQIKIYLNIHSSLKVFQIRKYRRHILKEIAYISIWRSLYNPKGNTFSLS